MVAATFDAAPPEMPEKLMPPPNSNVSAVASPKVTRPVLMNSTLAANVLPVPVMLNVYEPDLVIKSFTVTAPVNAAEAPVLIVKLPMATDVPLIAPFVPARRSRL